MSKKQKYWRTERDGIKQALRFAKSRNLEVYAADMTYRGGSRWGIDLLVRRPDGSLAVIEATGSNVEANAAKFGRTVLQEWQKKVRRLKGEGPAQGSPDWVRTSAIGAADKADDAASVLGRQLEDAIRKGKDITTFLVGGSGKAWLGRYSDDSLTLLEIIEQLAR